jgi:hypothetical protein
MVPVFRDIVHLLIACRDEMLSNLVMVVLVCCFFSVVLNALFRGKMDYRCCVTEDFESGVCGNATFAGMYVGDRPRALGPGTDLPVCGGGYMCEDIVDYDIILRNRTYEQTILVNNTNISSYRQMMTNQSWAWENVTYDDIEFDYGTGVCTEVTGGPNYGLFEYNSVSLAGYNVFTMSVLSGVEKKIWWTMDGAFYHSIWIYFGMLIVNHLVLLNLFFGAIVLGELLQSTTADPISNPPHFTTPSDCDTPPQGTALRRRRGAWLWRAPKTPS